MKNSISLLLLNALFIAVISVFVLAYCHDLEKRSRAEGHAAAMQQCKAQNSIQQDSAPQSLETILNETIFNY